MNDWSPQASYPCGNFSDTSCLKPQKPQTHKLLTIRRFLSSLSLRTPALLFDRCLGLRWAQVLGLPASSGKPRLLSNVLIGPYISPL
ncbi:hypothetical protein QQF64_009459 [Cirrhinus molitorella]|uniref:Uncharacterized protein n=1 Tax=Cirrhinus molitorella TaxID=172907 RepID=A0ABR3M4T7_9TELE